MARPSPADVGTDAPRPSPWNTRWQTACNLLCVALFSMLFVVFIIQVTARFGFNQPLVWTDEFAVILYIWVVLLGAVLCCREREHVAFDLVYSAVPASVQRVLRIASCVMLGGLFFWALPDTWSYIDFMKREKTPVLEYSFRWVYFPFMIFMVFVAVRQLFALRRLLGRSWRSEL